MESSERVSVKENKDADLLTSSASKDKCPMTPHEHCPLIRLVGGLVSRNVPKLKGVGSAVPLLCQNVWFVVDIQDISNLRSSSDRRLTQPDKPGTRTPSSDLNPIWLDQGYLYPCPVWEVNPFFEVSHLYLHARGT